MDTDTSSPRPLAVVTGASSGIGLELARQFAEHEFDLVIAAEDDELESARATLAALGVDVQAVQVDLATYDGVETLYAAVGATGRPVEAAALNAGVGMGGDFTETDLDAELRIVDLNVRSTVHLAKRLTTDMRQRGRGRILITSSEASRNPMPFQAVYGASKAFDQSFAQALRNELADHGISVTALLPGPTETEFFERADLMDTKVGTMDKDDAALVARQGFEGLMAGKANVVAGSLKTRVQTVASEPLPERAGAAVHRKLTEPGSAHS